MRKMDKKIDNAVREALTAVCEIALDKYAGFKWLTHKVNYKDFPNSLSIVCVFDTNTRLSDFFSNSQNVDFCRLIKTHLANIDVHLQAIDSHVSFDSEEKCSN